MPCPRWSREALGIAWDVVKFAALLLLCVGMCHGAIVLLLWSLGG